MEYRENKAGMASLAQSAGIASICMAAARRVEQSARAMPPPRIRDAADRRGYQAAFRSEPRMVEMAKARETRRRAGALVINDHELERVFGGKNRTLYRALGALDGVKIS